MTVVNPRERYEIRRARYTAARDAARARSRRLGSLRSLSFLGGAGLLLAADLRAGSGVAVLVAGGVLLLAIFVALVLIHRRVRKEEAWHDGLVGVTEEGLARLERRWDGLAPDPDSLPDTEHPYARDLDVAGDASLMRLLSGVATRPGRDRLRSWFLDPITGLGPQSPFRPERVVARQQGVAELAEEGEVRDRLTALGRSIPDPGEGVLETVEEWFGSEEVDESLGAAVVWVAGVVPWLTVGLVAVDLAAAGAQRWWLLPLLAGLWLLRSTRYPVRALFRGAGVGEAALGRLAPLVREVEGLEVRDPGLKALRARFGDGERMASAALRSLSRWSSMAESRRNEFYIALNLVFLLDIHVAHRLARWRRQWGPQVAGWLDALAELDALAALAALPHDHPDWTFPEYTVPAGGSDGPGEAAEARLVARGLGHPLLPADRCVLNDVEVGPAGGFLMVTGSNMSGKSTLLRALGTNVLLARAGAPVCANHLSLPPLRLGTCMRVEDSLAEGVSLFMAELMRLEGVVEAARRPSSVPFLYLLDEILQGTNTAERQIAARRVLLHLLDSGSIGAISTHDLALAEDPGLQAAARQVHFREHVERTSEGRPRLTFDYVLRPGLATSTNALTLLEIVGLS
jgi:hypothetical protein